VNRDNRRSPSFAVFATACFSNTRVVAGRPVSEPASQVHAKTMGTTNALCGQSALSWFKFWHVPFVTVQTDRCAECTAAFESRLATGGGA
jgi:hypothetical protein